MLCYDLERLDALLIDGRSGAGKTELAERISHRLRAIGREPQLLRVEHLYPGWDGLAEGSRALAAALDEGGYRRYDWRAGAFAEHVPVTRHRPLIIEGCGSLTAENLSAARRWAERAGGSGRSASVRGIWIECEAETRRSRALARDGEAYAPHWDRWAAQEEKLYGEHRPWRLADEVLRER
ncbi:hypothetical protein [Leucobacter sp. wl10]|uniref:hypothetical protein n=1 Tax=Leucobacter sp. wl10 TaxID=2304677 RepID=UPI000E5BFFDF|nr:hypothetical protein [Leucobacter sp. wl10]RGE24307.1 hypothetical protein D1J51_00785 [Leucobacter sp. wl10]